MKAFFSLAILCFFSYSTVQAQCDFEGGDFETWTDLSAQLDPAFEAGTLLVPDAISSIFRFSELNALDMNYVSEIQASTLSPEEKALAVFGFAQVTDADKGDFAVKISGNEKLPETAFALIGLCGSTPLTANFRLKHTSDMTDSIDLLVIVHQNLGFLDVGGLDADTLAAFGTLQLFADEDIPEYLDVEMELVLANPNATADSIYMEIVVESEIGEGGETGSYTLDNITFEAMTSSTGDIEQAGAVRIFPSIVDRTLNYRSAENDINELYIIDSSGKVLMHKKNPRSEDQIDASSWVPGNYFFQYRMDNKVRSMHFVKN